MSTAFEKYPSRKLLKDEMLQSRTVKNKLFTLYWGFSFFVLSLYRVISTYAKKDVPGTPEHITKLENVRKSFIVFPFLMDKTWKWESAIDACRLHHVQKGFSSNQSNQNPPNEQLHQNLTVKSAACNPSMTEGLLIPKISVSTFTLKCKPKTPLEWQANNGAFCLT